jgi:hypothetical protein
MEPRSTRAQKPMDVNNLLASGLDWLEVPTNVHREFLKI